MAENEKKRILVVDDEENAIQIMKTRLEAESSQYEVVVAKSGEEALKLAEVQKPDLILLDIMMPGVSGIEVCDMIRHNPDLSKTPIIIISALDDLKTQQECSRMGISAYITKPINGKLLDNKVAQVLEEAASAPPPPEF
jgi:CheY-like chemotaxis protein